MSINPEAPQLAVAVAAVRQALAAVQAVQTARLVTRT